MSLQKVLEFWSSDNNRSVSCSEDDINTVESRLGIQLPDEYKNLMMLSDGGVSDLEYLRGDVWISLPVFKSLKELILSSIEVPSGDVLVEKFLLLADDNYSFYGLNYDLVKPSVVYLDAAGNFEKMADSFDEFLELLSYDVSEVPEITKIIASQNEKDLELLVNKFGVNWRNKRGYTLVHLAAAMGAEKSLLFFNKMNISLNGAMAYAKSNNRDNIILILNQLNSKL